MRKPLALLAILLLAPSALAAAPASGEPTSAFVVFEPRAPASAIDALVSLGARVDERFPFIHAVHVTAPPAALAAIARLPFVATVDPVEPIAFLDRASAGLVRASVEARESTGAEDGVNVTVAVVDSGIDASHPGFAGRVKAAVRVLPSGDVVRASSDADGHGTHVAGIVAGSGAMSRDARHAGLAPAAGVVAVDISSSFTTLNAVRAFEWIAEHREEHNIRVVVNSWGREKTNGHYDPHDAVTRAANALVAQGVVVVFSAGNRGENGASSLTEEAMNPNVIAVGATDLRGRLEAYSSRGPAKDKSGGALAWTKPDLVAPGTGVWSARTSAKAPTGGLSEEDRYYVAMDGTSMAAPHVAAAAALLLSYDPTLTPQTVAALLLSSARDVGAPGADMEAGYGLLDVAGAFEALAATKGGVEAFTVLEARPVEAAGSVTAVAGEVVARDAAPRFPPEKEILIPLAVPANGQRARFDFAWHGGVGGFEVTLRSPQGEVVGPFPTRGDAVRVEAIVAPGDWQVVAKPTGLVSHVDYALEGFVDVAVVKTLRTPGKAPVAFGAPLWSDAADLIAETAAVFPALGAPLGALAIGGLAAAGGAVALRNRRLA